MSSDALFGRDGTQAPPPPRYYPDSLSSPADSLIDFADDMPRIVPVKPPGPPDPAAVQRAIDAAIAAERAQAQAKPQPKQRSRQRQPGAGPARPPMPLRPMPPALPEPEQPAKTSSGCGMLLLIFFVILLLGGFLNVVGNLFP